MRIAQIAPLMESVPPGFYGGTERVVSYLTEELSALGHEVTLFASGDSATPAPSSIQRARLRFGSIAHAAIRRRPKSSCWSASLAAHLIST